MDCGGFDINGNVYQLVKLGLFGFAEPKFVHPESGNRGVQFCAMGGTEHLYKVITLCLGMLGISSMSRDDNHTVRSIDLRHFWIPERHCIHSTRQSTTDAGYVKSEESVM